MLRTLKAFALVAALCAVVCAGTAGSAPDSASGKSGEQTNSGVASTAGDQVSGEKGKGGGDPKKANTGGSATDSASGNSGNASGAGGQGTGQAGASPADPKTASAVALGNQQIYEKSLAALTIILVVAVLLESAFATIFNWRVFLAYFNGSGVKTIVMVIVSLIVVYQFQLDIVSSLLAAYQTSPHESGLLSKFITALVLAGGSNGVYNILFSLGYRKERREEQVNPRPPADKAWLAIRVKKDRAVGDIRVKILDTTVAAEAAAKAAAAAKTEEAAETVKVVADKPPAPIAGTITFRRQPLGDLLLRSTNRFPPSGGYVVVPNHVYAITVEGKDQEGAELTALDSKKYVFAPGAIVDFTVSL